MFFINLQDPHVQSEIKKLCLGKSGVYRITNLQNNNQYVGSAITKKPSLNRLYIRFRNHFFNHHKPFPITRAIKKYGVSSFSWEVLEFTENSTTRTRETHWIQTLKPSYNILESGETSLGYSHTLETRQKMKKGYSQARRDWIGNLHKGKKVSPEIREKIARAALNRTPEQKQRHQQACDVFNKKHFSKPTQIVDASNLKVLATYSSLREACRALNGNYRTFKRVVKSGEKLTKLNIYVKYSS
jgi:group I intron endonuclease